MHLTKFKLSLGLSQELKMGDILTNNKLFMKFN